MTRHTKHSRARIAAAAAAVTAGAVFASTMAASSLAAPAPDRPKPSASASGSTAKKLCSPTLYVVDFSGRVRKVSTSVNRAFGAPIKIGKTPGSIVLTPSRKTAYVTNNGGGVSVIDLATNTVTDTVADPNLPTGIDISPNGATVYVANTKPAGVTAISTATNSATTTALPTVGGGYGIAAAANGQDVYLTAFSSSDQNLYVLDAATMAIKQTIPTGSHNKGITMSPDGKQLWIAANSTDSVQVLSTSTNEIVATIPVGNMPERITFTPDGSQAWVANLGGKSVTVIDTATLQPTATYAAGLFPFSVAFNANGTMAYVTNSIGGKGTVSPGTVTVLNAATGNKVKTIGGFAVPDNIILGPPSCIGAAAASKVDSAQRPTR